MLWHFQTFHNYKTPQLSSGLCSVALTVSVEVVSVFLWISIMILTKWILQIQGILSMYIYIICMYKGEVEVLYNYIKLYIIV